MKDCILGTFLLGNVVHTHIKKTKYLSGEENGTGVLNMKPGRSFI